MVFLSQINSQQSWDITAQDLKIYLRHNCMFSAKISFEKLYRGNIMRHLPIIPELEFSKKLSKKFLNLQRIIS